MKQLIGCTFVAGIFVLLGGANIASATVTVEGSQAFKDQVNACLQIITETDVDPAEVLRQLRNSPRTTTIHETDANINSTDYTNSNDANSPAAGGTGNGSDTSIDWNPTNRTNEENGAGGQPATPRDPCASLMHELRHALDGANGTRDPRIEPPPPAPDGIKHNEIEACREENLYRKKHPPLPQRRQYGGRDLPSSVIYP